MKRCLETYPLLTDNGFHAAAPDKLSFPPPPSFYTNIPWGGTWYLLELYCVCGTPL